jgi:hypothetical protein
VSLARELDDKERELADLIGERRAKRREGSRLDKTEGGNMLLNHQMGAWGEVALAGLLAIQYPDPNDATFGGDGGVDFWLEPWEWWRVPLPPCLAALGDRPRILVDVKTTGLKIRDRFQIFQQQYPIKADILVQASLPWRDWHSKPYILLDGWIEAPRLAACIQGPTVHPDLPDYSPQYWYPASALRPMWDGPWSFKLPVQEELDL